MTRSLSTEAEFGRLDSMEFYQHDSFSEFRFVLRGSLAAPWVKELEQAWITAASILKEKALVIDVSGLTGDMSPQVPAVISRWNWRSLPAFRFMRQRTRA